ncbi:MAG: GTP-binding protein, partial [Candidatus Marinimicrobia bacterium]|nr:GTP-binding protein [Candidatus Neomarinimicrobiota bacterium]
MTEMTAKDILNFALVGHGTSGKTMLAEAMLFNNGAINRMGSIEEGSTVSDYHDDEIERNISINSSLLNFTHHEKKFNVLDTPGYTDFYGEVKGALRVADFAVVVVNGVNNIEVGTDQVWNSVSTYGIPHLIVVNMLDKEMANFDAVIDEARERFGSKVFPLGLPVNTGPGFNKIADVLRNELFTYKNDGSGQAEQTPLDGELAEKISKLHGELIELVAESDDSLLEKFFEKDELTEDELRGGLHGAFMSHGLIPVFPISASNNIGVSRLMDVLAKYAPCAADFTEVTGVNSAG